MDLSMPHPSGYLPYLYWPWALGPCPWALKDPTSCQGRKGKDPGPRDHLPLLRAPLPFGNSEGPQLDAERRSMSSLHSVCCHTMLAINAGRAKWLRALMGMLLSHLCHLTSPWSCLSVSALPKGSGGRCAYRSPPTILLCCLPFDLLRTPPCE